MAKFQKKSSKEIAEEVKELNNFVIDSIKNYSQSPEDTKELLDFMSNFPERSFRNQLLIEKQFPGAQACLGRYDLQKNKIYIKKGEVGNQIFVRKSVKGFYNEQNQFLRVKEANKEQKEKIERNEINIIKKPYYSIEKVFDITQTQLKKEDYPKLFPGRVFDFELNESGKKELNIGIQSLSKEMDVSIMNTSQVDYELGTARGAYIYDNQGNEQIILNHRNTETQNLATTIHELAHAKMHKFSEMPTDIKELQAEMTSYIVSKYFGMDTSEEAIPYIADWTDNGKVLDNEELIERGKVLSDVSRVSNQFIRSISTGINQYRDRELELEIEEKDIGPAIQESEDNIMLEEIDSKKAVPVDEKLWIDRETGNVSEDNTGRTFPLKEAKYIHSEDEIILVGQLYGDQVKTMIKEKDFFNGEKFKFNSDILEKGHEKRQHYQKEQQMNMERI